MMGHLFRGNRYGGVDPLFEDVHQLRTQITQDQLSATRAN